MMSKTRTVIFVIKVAAGELEDPVSQSNYT